MPPGTPPPPRSATAELVLWGCPLQNLTSCTCRFLRVFLALVVVASQSGVRPFVDSTGLGPRFRPRGICSNKDNPACYHVVLVYLFDGSFIGNLGPLTDETPVLDTFGLIGYTRQEVIDEARSEAHGLLDRYGLDFTTLPDHSYLFGETIRPGLIFRPAIFGGNYRLVSGYRQGQILPFNNHINEVSWQIIFTEDFNSTGSFTGTIPAGAFVVAGSYVIDLCEHHPGYCSPFTTLGLQTRFLHLRFISRTFITPLILGPDIFFPIHCEVRHEVWGEGLAQGFSHALNGTLAGPHQAHSVIRFPRSLPEP